ncbi:MAG: DMT family transporter [Spirochaetes bacterium]|nr:DMT family transporter [Spirochaetota bacterium]
MEKLYAVIGMAANAAKDTLFKTVAREDGGSRILLFYGFKSALIAVLALPVILFILREPLLHPTSLAFALPTAALAGLAYLAALRSLVAGDASTNVTIIRLNFVLTSAFAVLFGGEALTPRKIAGTALCLLAVLLFYLGGRSRGADHRGLAFSMLACLAMAVLNIVNKTALRLGASVLHLVLYRYVLIAAFCALVLAARRQSLVPSPRLALVSGACAVLMLGSMVFVLTALQTGDLTLVIPISQCSFLFTALFSFLWLGERLDWGKVTGLAAAVTGLIVIR